MYNSLDLSPEKQIGISNCLHNIYLESLTDISKPTCSKVNLGLSPYPNAIPPPAVIFISVITTLTFLSLGPKSQSHPSLLTTNCQQILAGLH